MQNNTDDWLNHQIVEFVSTNNEAFRTLDDEMAFNNITLFKKAITQRIEEAENRAREDAIWQIMSPKTEGLFSDGDLFIKRKPIEDAIIGMVGYEKYKALQEAVDQLLSASKPTSEGESK